METDDTILDIESRSYVNPQTGLDERMQFIDTLRDVQAQNTAQINQNTYNLGSQVPSNVGGLTGSEGLWQAQYANPYIDAQVADLNAVADAVAKDQIVSNLNAITQNRYKQALRDFYARRKAENDATKNPTPTDTTAGNIKTETVPEGKLGNINPDGSINATVSGPAGTTATGGEGYTDYQNEAGETVRHYDDGRIEVIKEGQTTTVQQATPTPTGESVNDAIKRIENTGKTVTNRRITADEQGNVTLTWVDKDGNEGSETIKVNVTDYRAGIY